MALIIKQTDNLCNYYLLPLLKLSPVDFKTGNFINSYFNMETFELVVELEEMRDEFKKFPCYKFSIDKEFKAYLFFSIPEQFHEDVGVFVVGKYSRFSKLAKAYIEKYSKLPYQRTTKGVAKSVWLHVLDRSEDLKSKIESQLGTTIPDYMELASVPNKNNFFNR
jgi:hypothetical protein